VNDTKVDFITKKDENKWGRIIYKERYYALPIDVMLDFKRLKDKELKELENK
jgi:hypothetical protein